MQKALQIFSLPILATILTAIYAAVPADAQVSARDYNRYTLVDSIAGGVGGVAADRAGNIYDSLGEAYMNAGKSDLAIEFYEKSLERNAANSNAVQMLKKLRGDAG